MWLLASSLTEILICCKRSCWFLQVQASYVDPQSCCLCALFVHQQQTALCNATCIMFVDTITCSKEYYTHWQVTCKHADRADDDMRTGLPGHLAALMPQAVIMPKGRLSSTTSKVLKASLRQPRLHQLPAGVSRASCCLVLSQASKYGRCLLALYLLPIVSKLVSLQLPDCPVESGAVQPWYWFLHLNFRFESIWPTVIMVHSMFLKQHLSSCTAWMYISRFCTSKPLVHYTV